MGSFGRAGEQDRDLEGARLLDGSREGGGAPGGDGHRFLPGPRSLTIGTSAW